MSSLLLILLSTVLVNIVALGSIPAWRPFMTSTTGYDAARALAVANVAVVIVATGLGWLLSHLLLASLNLTYLRTLVFVAVILVVVPVVEMVFRRQGSWLPQRPAFGLLLATNPAVLGIALMTDARMTSIIDAMLFTVGIAFALGFLLLAFATMVERLRYADVPAVFRDAPVALVALGIMALAFMGFTGLIQE
jgi:H+/Na+-translocating ferredoxin:NAD+ oxidoreductase subunit A